MPEPIHIAAIDAGSNAVRLSVARAHSALDIEPLQSERYPLRLGESVFLRQHFSKDVFKKAAKAFRHFHDIMDEFGVARYRAVATSATREAENRDAFVRAIKRKSGVLLEVISAAAGRPCWRPWGLKPLRAVLSIWAAEAWRSASSEITTWNKALSCRWARFGS